MVSMKTIGGLLIIGGVVAASYVGAYFYKQQARETEIASLLQKSREFYAMADDKSANYSDEDRETFRKQGRFYIKQAAALQQ